MNSDATPLAVSGLSASYGVVPALRNVDLQIRWVNTNIHRIVQRSRRRGPFIDVVLERTMARDWPKEAGG